MSPRYIEKPRTDPSGLRAESDLPLVLPYNLKPNDFLRVVEDVHEVLHEINTLLHGKSYERLDELLDRAGFSGFISRTVVDRLDRASRSLAKNEYHNGFPDLLPRGAYPGNKVQHGEVGGLEVKASRSQSSWQSHGPRGGWFCVVQFEIDQDESKAVHDLEPTRLRAILVAELTQVDWSWQPAGEGRIRSGTASIKPLGVAKLRSGAVWVDPPYEERHQELLVYARLRTFREQRDEMVLTALGQIGGPARALDIAGLLSGRLLLPADRLKSPVETALRKLLRRGAVNKVKPGLFELPP